MKLISLIGNRYGKLTVEAREGSEQGHVTYLCKCDCGKSVVVIAQSLKKGDTKSCGCLRADKMRIEKTVHGLYQSPTYNSWRAMIARVNDKKHPQFKDYGGRGITIQESWYVFENFLTDMGKRQTGKTLDRIENNGNYEKDNCRWATRIQQNNNKRKNYGNSTSNNSTQK